MDDGIDESGVDSFPATISTKTEVAGVGKLMKTVHYEGGGRRTEGKCSILDLSCKDDDTNDTKLCKFNCLDFSSYSLNNFRNLHVLLLRNNRLSDLAHMNLSEMRCLIHLDLACNQLTGEISNGVFPPSLEKLDISGNFLECLSGLIWCPNLVTLNISNNRIKAISALPPKLIELNISNNRLTGITNLRHLSLSPLISSLRIQGNPVVEPAGLFRATVKSILTKLEQLDGEYLPGHKLRKQKVTPEEQVVSPRRKSQQQQKESDQLRHEEYSRRLEEREIRRNLNNHQIDNSNNSRSLLTPTKADQMESDRQRMHFNSNRESILEQERTNIVEHLTAQYKRKQTLTKESTKNIIAKMRNASPYNVTVKTPPPLTLVPVSVVRTSPHVRAAPTSGGAALPIQTISRELNGKTYSMSCDNIGRNQDRINDNESDGDSDSDHNNNPDSHGDTNEYEEDYDNKNDVSDITHNNTVYSKNEKYSRLYPPQESTSTRYSSNELNYDARASSSRNNQSRLKVKHYIENHESGGHDIRNEIDSDCENETYSHIYDTRNQKEDRYTDTHNKNCYNELTIKTVKYRIATDAELQKISMNFQKDNCINDFKVGSNQIDADADVTYEVCTVGHLKADPRSSSNIFEDCDVTRNSSKVTTMEFQTLDESMLSKVCHVENMNENEKENKKEKEKENKNENMNENENEKEKEKEKENKNENEKKIEKKNEEENEKKNEKENEDEKETVGIETRGEKKEDHNGVHNRENVQDLRERGSAEEKGREEHSTRNIETGVIEINNRKSQSIKKEVEVTLGDVVALACELAIVQNKEGLLKVKQEITSSSEKSKREESNDIEIDAIRGKNRIEINRLNLDEAGLSDGETLRSIPNKNIKIEERIFEIKLSNGGTTILDIDKMKEINDVILEKKELKSTSYSSSASRDTDNLTTQLDPQRDMNEQDTIKKKDNSETGADEDGIKLSKNQKKKANRKKIYNLISEDKVKDALTMKEESENDEKNCNKNQYWG